VFESLSETVEGVCVSDIEKVCVCVCVCVCVIRFKDCNMRLLNLSVLSRCKCCDSDLQRERAFRPKIVRDTV